MAGDIHVKIEGTDSGEIKSESKHENHKDWLDVDSVQWGISAPSQSHAGGGQGAGKASFSDIVMTGAMAKHSPILAKVMATGEHLKKVTISVRKSGGKHDEYLWWILEDAILTNMSHSGHGTDSFSEMLSVAFAKVEFNYKPQKADGSLDSVVTFKQDLKSTKAS